MRENWIKKQNCIWLVNALTGGSMWLWTKLRRFCDRLESVTQNVKTGESGLCRGSVDRKMSHVKIVKSTRDLHGKNPVTGISSTSLCARCAFRTMSINPKFWLAFASSLVDTVNESQKTGPRYLVDGVGRE